MKNDDRTFYLACPECKKKVMEESCGWRCESCDKAMPTCIPTYMLLAKISDVSECIFVNFYRDEGTALMGLKADKLRELKEQGDIQVINEVYQDRLYRPFGFMLKVRARSNPYEQQSAQYNYVCQKVMPHSFKIANKMLIERLGTYKALMGYNDEALSDNVSTKRRRTASEEERRQQAFANHEAETRKIKQEKG